MLDDKSPSFQFYDQNGKQYITFGLNDDQMPFLEFWDKYGHKRIALIVDDIHGSPSLDFKDGNMRTRMTLRLDSGGKPFIFLADKSGHELIELVVSEEDDEDEGEYPVLGFRDKNGKLRASILLDEGNAGIDFRDQQGKTRLMLMLDGLEDPRLLFFDKDMKQVWSAP